MTHTSLAFYRKDQTFDKLQTERPQSVESVRRCVAQALEEVESKLQGLEFSFYGNQHADENIRGLLPTVCYLTERLHVYYFHASWQMRQILEGARRKRTEPDGEALMTAGFELNHYHEKILSHVPKAFEPFKDDILKIQSCLQRYCRSFYKECPSEYMETPRHYEDKILEMKTAVSSHLDNINIMASTYRQEGGTHASVFGLEANELARRCDIGHLPFLLLFPQACQNIRKCIDSLSLWLDEDAKYAEFIKHDVQELEIKKMAQNKILRDVQQKAVRLEKHINTLDRDIKTLHAEIHKVKHREVKLDQEIHKLSQDIKMINFDIDTKKEEIETIKHNIKTGKPGNLNEQYEQNIMDIGKLTLQIPEIEQQIEQVQEKKRFILEKRFALRRKKEERQRLKATYQDALGDVAREQRRENDQIRSLAQLKHIYICRTSQGVMKKIFQNSPIEARSRASKSSPARLRLRKTDSFDQTLISVAKMIASDWRELYRKLPFKPSRSRGLLESDIDDVVSQSEKSSATVYAQASLSKWRDLQPSVTKADLEQALRKIGREDIISMINRKNSIKTLKLPLWKKKPTRKYEEVKSAANSFLMTRGPFRFATAVDSLDLDGNEPSGFGEELRNFPHLQTL